MPHRLDLSVNSHAVFSDYRRLHGAGLVLNGFWEPHQNLVPGSRTCCFRVDAGRLQTEPMLWDDAIPQRQAQPEAVRRALVPLTAYYENLTTGFASWKPDVLKVRHASQAWFMLGAVWRPDGRFSILTQPAGADLKAHLAVEPVLVPPAHYQSWLDPAGGANYYFPPPPGVFATTVLK